MTSPLKVSIITPSYNQGQFLGQTIESVLDQDYQNLEYFVIDGGSTDGSQEIIQRYRDQITYWVSEPDQGQAHAINKGLRRASGDILSWINSDDTLAPGVVQRAVRAFEKEPGIDVVHGSVNWIDEQGSLILKPSSRKVRDEFGLHNLISSGVTQAGAFWRRPIMDQVGLLDEGLHYVMDYDFWVRMALAGARFHRLHGDPVANRRMTRQAKTLSQNEKLGFEKLQVLDRILADPRLSEKLGISPQEIHSQQNKARSLAHLRVFFAYSRRKGRRTEALQWLACAVRLYPPVLISRQLIKSLFYYRLLN